VYAVKHDRAEPQRDLGGDHHHRNAASECGGGVAMIEDCVGGTAVRGRRAAEAGSAPIKTAEITDEF